MSLEFPKREIAACKLHSKNRKDLGSTQKCRGDIPDISWKMLDNMIP